MKSKACFKRVLNIQQINVLRVFTFIKNRLVTEPGHCRKTAWRYILGAELDSDPRLLVSSADRTSLLAQYQRRRGNGLTRASERPVDVHRFSESLMCAEVVSLKEVW